ncbi:MAG: beta-propeller domain-containing protein [Oscillospiraceae bacterium]|nr:beta-propeller domain-containing protein [Oscillospiraceae bacterium]
MIETLNSERFLAEIKKLNLSGADFLEIIGNSKINNETYNEIKESAGLTYSRLVELLDNSLLNSDDFAGLLSDACKLASIRGKERRLNNEERLGKALLNAQKAQKAQKRLAEQERLQKEAESVPTAKDGAYEVEVDFSDDDYREDVQIKESGEPEIKDEPDDGEETVLISASDNKGKLSLCFFMMFLLIGASFAVRWFMTGSLLPDRERPVVYSVPQTYLELAERLAGAEALPSLRNIIENGDTSGGNGEPAPKTLLFTDRYIFYIIDNVLYIVEYRSGNMHKAGEIRYDGETILGIELLNEQLYVMSQGGEEVSYFHEEKPTETEETGESGRGKILSDDFIQPIVLVRVYDTREFNTRYEFEMTVCGEYNSTILRKDRFILVTDYTPREPHAYSDLSAFVPFYTVGGEKSFVDMNNIYAPPASLMNNQMNLISVIDVIDQTKELSVNVFAVVGGAGEVYSGEEALFITQSAGGKSRLIRFDVSGEFEPLGENPPFYFDINGTIPAGAVSERYSILRVGVINSGNKCSLYIFNNDLEPLSRVINIGSDGDAPIKDIIFDGSLVYFVSDRLYAFDAASPEEVVPIAEPPPIAVTKGRFFKGPDNEKLEVAGESNPDGERAGIRLSLHKDGKIVSTYLITADSGVEGDWNQFLFTDAEYYEDAVFISKSSENRGTIILPVKFSNGITDIEKILVFDYNNYDGEEMLVKRYEIIYIYELGGGNKSRKAILADGYIYSFWDTTAVSTEESGGTVIMQLELAE